MKYMGSELRLQKYIVPIIQEYLNTTLATTYIEPFVGGANMIEAIKFKRKIGYDNNKYLIALLDYVSRNGLYGLPEIITKKHYSEVRESYNENTEIYHDHYIGYIGFIGSYNGRFFDGGYSGHDVKGRDYIKEARANLKNQIKSIKETSFIHADYKNIKPYRAVIYCDPPYKGTKQYNTSKNFDYEQFYNTCRLWSNSGNIVLVSEYEMPEDFKCIWEKTMNTNLMDTMGGTRKQKTEKLFILQKEV